MWKYLVLGISLLFFFQQDAVAQETEQDSLVHLSGLVLDGTTNELLPIPYANVYVQEESKRGDYTDFKGYFTLVAKKGETVVFSTIGYKTVEFVVPDTLKDNRYSIVQLMTQDTFNLPDTVVFPWPSREHFKLEFLAMDVTKDMQERALNNLGGDVIERLIKELPYDGKENANYYLREQAKTNYYIGQTPPMNIFNPIAWKKFFDAWKDGKFKNEDKDKNKK